MADIHESFDVVEDSDDDTEILSGDWTPDYKKNQERMRLVERIKKMCGPDDGSDKKPLHVAIIGSAGVGKSAFINTLAAALGQDRWREFAYSGYHGTEGSSITVFTTSFKKCCQAEKFPKTLLPTLIDIAGFEDQEGEQFVELLRIVFYGRLPEGESLFEAAEYHKSHGLMGLRSKYSTNNEKLKVDRVLFVHAATQPVPENLIRCVIQAARPSGTKGDIKRRTIPIFGVMTKTDKVGGEDLPREKYEKRKLNFIHALGLGGSTHRFLSCSNYCDDVDKNNKRIDTVIPDLDLPVLRFFTQVSDPVIKVMNPDESYEGKKAENDDLPEPEIETQHTTTRRTPERVSDRKKDGGSGMMGDLGGTMMSAILISVEALLVAFVLSYLLKPAVDMTKLKGACNFMEKTGLPNEKTRMGEICTALANTDLSSMIPFIVALFSLIAIRVAATLATIHIFKK